MFWEKRPRVDFRQKMCKLLFLIGKIEAADTYPQHINKVSSYALGQKEFGSLRTVV